MSAESNWQAVVRYSAAKSRADVDGALAECVDDFVLATLPFGTCATGSSVARMHLAVWFSVFADYEANLVGHLAGDDTVSCWGRASATMTGSLGPVVATNRRFDTDFMCVFGVVDGRITSERFLFDLADVCRQLDIAASDIEAALASFAAVAA